MALIAIELSDAGIIAAAGNPARRIPVDGTALESPGYILPAEQQLSVGHAAKNLAHHYPRRIQHRFWDQLSAMPLKQPEPWASNHAEMAHKHLSAIWQRAGSSGTSVLITLPGFFTKDQMGLLLGIAQDLDIEVSGLINQAVAACPHRFETPHLLYADVHLHRTEVSLLGQGNRLALLKTLTLDKGLIHIQRKWIEAMAQAFVTATRYDPLHAAASEQELYDRLPDVLRALDKHAATAVEMRSDHAVHSISLGRETFIHAAGEYYEQIDGLIRSLLENQGQEKGAAVLLLSHRLAHWTGFHSHLRNRLPVKLLALPPGAAAKQALGIRDQLERPSGETGAFYFKQRAWAEQGPSQEDQAAIARNPSHLLCDHIAYAFARNPLAIVAKGSGAQKKMEVVIHDPDRTDMICSVGMEENEAVLRVPDTRTIYVDGRKFTGRMKLTLGQTLQASENDDPIRLIACL